MNQVFKKLKVRLTVNVFLTLNFAMLLIGFISLFFFYHYQLQALVNRAVTVLSFVLVNYSEEIPLTNLDVQLVQDNVDQILGEGCVFLKPVDRAVGVNRNGFRSSKGFFSSMKKINDTSYVIKYITGYDLPFIKIPLVIEISTVESIDMLKLIDQENGAYVAFIQSDKLVEDVKRLAFIIASYILLNGVVLAVLSFFRLKYHFFDKIDNLVEIANDYQITEGNYFFPELDSDELGHLSRSINSMIGRIEEDRKKLFDHVKSLEKANVELKTAQDEVVRAEKLAAAGRLFAGLAHEVGNPVAIVQGYLELLEHDDIDPEDRRQFARRGIQELHRIDNLLSQLLDATRKDDGHVEKVDLNRLVHNLIDILEVSFEKKQIEVTPVYAESPLYVLGNREKFHQVLLNMVLNSMDAVAGHFSDPFAARIGLTVRPDNRDDGMWALIEIKDNGRGIPNEDLDVIFEPFFTTKGPGKGTGLGLAVSYRIIQSYGGRIDVSSEVDKGSVFTIALPVYIQEKPSPGNK